MSIFWGTFHKALFLFSKTFLNHNPNLYLTYAIISLRRLTMKVIVLTHTIKENMPAWSGTDTLKQENYNHSPIRAIAWFE